MFGITCKEEIDSEIREKFENVKKELDASSILSITPTIMMLTPYIINIESEELDQVLEKILEIRKMPKKERAEAAGDYISELMKKLTIAACKSGVFED